MFKIEIIERRNPDDKIIYVSSLGRENKIIFTNRNHILDFHKDLDKFFQEYYFMLEVFYTRVKMLDFQLSQDNLFGQSTATVFYQLEEMRLNIFVKRNSPKVPSEVAGYINQFNATMMVICFRASKVNHVEAEKFYHLLHDLQTKFYSVFRESYNLHKSKSLKLFI